MLFTAIRLIPIARTRGRRRDDRRDWDSCSSRSGGNGCCTLSLLLLLPLCATHCQWVDMDLDVHNMKDIQEKYFVWRWTNAVAVVVMMVHNFQLLFSLSPSSLLLNQKSFFFFRFSFVVRYLLIFLRVFSPPRQRPAVTTTKIHFRMKDSTQRRNESLEDFCYFGSRMLAAIVAGHMREFRTEKCSNAQNTLDVLSAHCAQPYAPYTFAINFIVYATTNVRWNSTNRWRWHLTHKCLAVSQQFYRLRPARNFDRLQIKCQMNEEAAMNVNRTKNTNTNELKMQSHGW